MPSRALCQRAAFSSLPSSRVVAGLLRATAVPEAAAGARRARPRRAAVAVRRMAGGAAGGAVDLFCAVTGSGDRALAERLLADAGGDANAAADAFFRREGVEAAKSALRGVGGTLVLGSAQRVVRGSGIERDAEREASALRGLAAPGRGAPGAHADAQRGWAHAVLPAELRAAGFSALREFADDVAEQCASDAAANDALLRAVAAESPRALYCDSAFPAGAASIDGGGSDGGEHHTPPQPPACRCGDGQPATCKRVSKDGPNQGKLFYCCARELSAERCGFFAWAPRGARPSRPQRAQAERVWRRCSPPLFRLAAARGPSADDVRQGSVGDCWFVSVLAVLATRPSLVRMLLPQPSAAAAVGAHRVRLFIDGHWRELLLDDKFPCTVAQGHRLAYAKAAGAEGDQLWVPLLEKAYARAHGSYSAISGGWMAEAMLDVTGCSCESVWFHEKGFDFQLTWARMLSWADSGFMLALATGAGGAQLRKTGLVGGHAYSVLEVREITDARPSRQTKLSAFFAGSSSELTGKGKEKADAAAGARGRADAEVPEGGAVAARAKRMRVDDGVASTVDLTTESASDDDCIVVSDTKAAHAGVVDARTRGDAELAKALQREEGHGLGDADVVCVGVAEAPAYSFEDEVLRLVSIRNPHGRGTGFTGDFGRKSAVWNDKLRAVLGGASRTARSDGSFWMTYEDVVKHFVLLDCCRVPRGPFFSGSFDVTIEAARTDSGSSLVLRALGGLRAPVQVASVQPTKRSRMGESHWYVPSGLAYGDGAGQGLTARAHGADRVASHSVMVSEVPVCISAFSLHTRVGKSASLVLRVVSPVPLAVREVPCAPREPLCLAFARAAIGEASGNGQGASSGARVSKRHYLGAGSMLACVGTAADGDATLVAVNASASERLFLRLAISAKSGSVKRGPGARQPVLCEDGSWAVCVPPGACRVVASAAALSTWEWAFEYRYQRERASGGAWPAPTNDGAWAQAPAPARAGRHIAAAEAAAGFRPEARGGYRRGCAGARCVAA